jgi:6-phosphofructokinase
VAAHAALASGRAELVLVPEMFMDTDGERLPDARMQALLDQLIEHLRDTIILRPGERHAIIVVAEGVPKLLAGRVRIGQVAVGEDEDAGQVPFLDALSGYLSSGPGWPRCFINRPQHYIRAVAPNVHDRIYCERLGSVAVDAGLAGFTDVMVSKRLDQYVLVPLPLVVPPPPFEGELPGPRCYGGQRYLFLQSTFWRQVEESTGQPSWPCGVMEP